MKKILPVAVLAALAGVNSAQAVHVNPDGTGQVLVYPFYSVEGGKDTYINLVNTTDDYKAVKIRILESMNSQEVLDFNLYLSPQDHWSAVITTDAGGGAAIQSNDVSCTVPTAVSEGDKIPFRTFSFPDDSVKGVERTREGYLEVIEMGTVTDSDYQAAIDHVTIDCDAVAGLWNPGGVWFTNPNDGVAPVSGGLYGYGVLINVAKGTDASYDAVAVDDWIDSQGSGYFHSSPGDTLPSIVSGADLGYDVFDEGGVVSGVAFSGRDAVSATMMQATISNDYVLESDINAGTDWVVTFPTKRFYVNFAVNADAPFTDVWDEDTSKACEEFGNTYWDREEATESSDPSDFSPQPPPGANAAFCYEANVLTFNGSSVLEASARTQLDFTLDDGFENGWARIDFTGEGRQLVTQDDVFQGLPVVGFAVQQYINGTLPGGVLSNYQGTNLHKGDRAISITSSVN